MALYELEESEDDYVFLSDVECDTDYAANSLRPRRSQDYSKALASSSQQHQSQGHSSQHYGTLHKSQEEEDSDLEDIETIEYGYENDTLLIMPAMLRDYSHHATNYHPELWRSPIPGSYTSQPSLARYRMLDRQELLKNSISPTTCGICFEAFTTFNLDPLQQPEVKTKEISSQAQTPIPIESAELVLDAETLEIWYRKLAEVHVANKV
ncbi:hypothetical protein BGZ54_000250 [Gamsiella multidivaricata]|nr:hypothetical protein BGZ54_000250 [Gamsiella multidivaricata]